MNKIKKENLLKKLNDLFETHTIFAPNGKDFSKIDNISDIKRDGLTTRLSAKDVFLPSEEVLFNYNDEKINVPEKQKNIVVFGIRPCEVKAIEVLDKNFDTNDDPDSYYIKRRENSIIISEACLNPEETCFCTSFGIDPFYKGISDIILIDKGDYYLIDGNEDALSIFKNLIEDMDSSDLKWFEDVKKESISKVDKLNLQNFDKKLDSVIENLPIWEELSKKCITCGTCTYLCPTCYCFDIQDIGNDKKFERIRVWDSCMHKIYTQEASGHNPRNQELKRMRQRIMHKFSYYPHLYNEYGCVGCGRCIIYCPVNFDIREAVRILEAL